MFVERDEESRCSTMHTRHGCSHGKSVPDCVYISVIKVCCCSPGSDLHRELKHLRSVETHFLSPSVSEFGFPVYDVSELK